MNSHSLGGGGSYSKIFISICPSSFSSKEFTSKFSTAATETTPTAEFSTAKATSTRSYFLDLLAREEVLLLHLCPFNLAAGRELFDIVPKYVLLFHDLVGDFPADDSLVDLVIMDVCAFDLFFNRSTILLVLCHVIAKNVFFLDFPLDNFSVNDFFPNVIAMDVLSHDLFSGNPTIDDMLSDLIAKNVLFLDFLFDDSPVNFMFSNLVPMDILPFDLLLCQSSIDVMVSHLIAKYVLSIDELLSDSAIDNDLPDVVPVYVLLVNHFVNESAIGTVMLSHIVPEDVPPLHIFFHDSSAQLTELSDSEAGSHLSDLVTVDVGPGVLFPDNLAVFAVVQPLAQVVMIVPVMVQVNVRHAEIATVVIPGMERVMVPMVWMVTLGVTASVMLIIFVVR